MRSYFMFIGLPLNISCD